MFTGRIAAILGFKVKPRASSSEAVTEPQKTTLPEDFGSAYRKCLLDVSGAALSQLIQEDSNLKSLTDRDIEALARANKIFSSLLLTSKRVLDNEILKKTVQSIGEINTELHYHAGSPLPSHQ